MLSIARIAWFPDASFPITTYFVVVLSTNSSMIHPEQELESGVLICLNDVLMRVVLLATRVGIDESDLDASDVSQ